MSELQRTRIHSFSVDLACRYGLEKAVILQHLIYWILKNKADGRMCKNGFWWTFSSAESMQEIFPYFKSVKIARLMRLMEQDNIILSSNHNANKWNRSKWYTIIDPYILEHYMLECLEALIPLLNNKQSIVKIYTMDCKILNNVFNIIKLKYNIKINNSKTDGDDVITDKELPLLKTPVETLNAEWLRIHWNELAASKPHLPKKRKVSEDVLTHLNARIKEHPRMDDWKALFQVIKESPVLGIDPELKWFGFDFIFRPGKFDKIMEGWMDWKKVESTLRTVHSDRYQQEHEQLKKSV